MTLSTFPEVIGSQKGVMVGVQNGDIERNPFAKDKGKEVSVPGLIFSLDSEPPKINPLPRNEVIILVPKVWL